MQVTRAGTFSLATVDSILIESLSQAR